jgi:hypothetical protein
MKTLFDTKTLITYEISSNIPKIDRMKSLLAVRMLCLYSMYRNGLYDSRIVKPLDEDIAIFKPRFEYEHTQDSVGVNNHLYHYASYIGLDAMQELFKQENSKCCVAYRTSGGKKTAVGFLVFYEVKVNDRNVVYISHVSVGEFRRGVGTKLIQTVFQGYPADTLFYLCARKSNQDALTVYEKLGFFYDHSYVEKFGYNPDNFVGMACITNFRELEEMKHCFKEEPPREIYFHP